MYHDVSHLLSRLINGPTPLRQIYFASTNSTTPELAYQVDFPRLEIVLEGEFADSGIDKVLTPGDVLFVPAGGWNIPQWVTPVTTLSILFGKQQLGFSVVQWDGKQYQNLPTSTSLGADRVSALFCCKRSMRCKCSRRSSKRPG